MEVVCVLLTASCPASDTPCCPVVSEAAGLHTAVYWGPPGEPLSPHSSLWTPVHTKSSLSSTCSCFSHLVVQRWNLQDFTLTLLAPCVLGQKLSWHHGWTCLCLSQAYTLFTFQPVFGHSLLDGWVLVKNFGEGVDHVLSNVHHVINLFYWITAFFCDNSCFIKKTTKSLLLSSDVGTSI